MDSASVSVEAMVEDVCAEAVAASSKVLPEMSLVQLPADIIKAITAASIRLLLVFNKIIAAF